jgi:hypothetical protein
MLLERLGSLFQPDPNEPKGFATKDEIAERRKMARRLQEQGTSTAPVSSGYEAIARVLGTVNGMVQDYSAKREDRDAYAEARKREAALFGGDPTTPAASPQPMNINPVAVSDGGAGIGGGGMRSPGMAGGVAGGKGYDRPEARAIYDRAIAAGYSPVQASAFTGAALAESSYRTDARNPSDGRDGSDSVGLFQWNGPRAQSLKSYAAQRGTDWRDRDTQVAFALQEKQGPEKFAGDALRSAKTPEEASAAMLHYLRPGGYTRDNPLGASSAGARIRNTNAILGLYGNQPAAQPANAPSGPAGTPWAGITPEAANAMRQPVQAAPQGQTSPQQQPPVQVAQAAPAASAGPSVQGLMSIMNDERASPGAKAAAQFMLQKRLASETKDPVAAALQQEQLTGARLNNAKVARDLQEQGFSDRDRPDGSILRIFRDGTTRQMAGPIAKPESDTAYMKELEAENATRKQRNLPPLSISEYRTSLNRAGATTINNVQKAEGEFDKKFVGNQGEMFAKFLEQKANVESDTADIGMLRDIMKEGLPTGVIAAAQSGLGKLGIQTQGLDKIEGFNAIINRMVPAQRQPGSGTMSDRDVELYRSSLPSLLQTPEGRTRILNTMEGMTRYKSAQATIAERLSVGEIDRNQALQELRKIPNPLEWVRQQNKGNSGAAAGAAAGSATPSKPAATGQPNAADIAAEMKRRGLQ